MAKVNISIPGVQATQGVAVDEMVLAGAMLGSVGIFAAAAVPWDSVIGTSKPQQLPEIAQIEQANAAFFERHRKWPHQVTDGSWTANAAALSSQKALKYPYRSMSQFSPVLDTIAFDGTQERVILRHDYGEGGRILQGPSDDPHYAMQVIFENMPLASVQEMDMAVDSSGSLEEGRLRARFRAGKVDMVYYSNPQS